MRTPTLWLPLSGFAFSLLAACSSVPTTSQAPAPPVTAQTKIHRLKVGYVSGASSIGGTTADSILAGATHALRGVDTAGDSSADVVLQRDGAMRVISGPSVINSAADFAQLKSSGLNIVVVSGINYCGSFIPNIVGCAPLSGNLLAVVRMSSFEDILWAHEFGHNCGLPHRADSNAIMHPQMATQHRVLLRSEAARYENKSFGSSGRLTPGANAGDEPFTVALDDGPPPATLEEYLGRIYLHGIPFAHVAGFGPEHVPRLQGILANPSQEKIWGNAAVALAAIATPGAIDAVNKFIFAGSGRLSPDAYQAKRAAMMALGYASQQAVRRSSPERRQAVLAQLRAGLAPDYWRQRVNWRGPGDEATAETALQLSDTAFAGLALSGASEAVPWFTEAAQSIRAAEGRVPIARKALEELRKVRALGLRAYTDPHRSHPE